ncbi:MAG: molybdopterin-dependent oxidoreductase [Candidatus Bathyarchaeia archaeon]
MVVVDVEGDRIVRIRPLHYDMKYDPKDVPCWEIEARGKVFKPLMKELPPPFRLVYKRRVYSPNRVKYPLKRVDWDPEGDRHPENRGKSGYVRISWEEALNIITKEIKRVIEKYGPYAILAQSEGHSQTKTYHGGAHGVIPRLLWLLGGCTYQTRNPDSWEGYWWGAKHVWGMEPVGLADSTNVVIDVAQNSDILLCWGCDYESTTWGVHDQGLSLLGFWFSELNIKQIFICPNLNYAAAVHADKWIPVRPNTDAALQLAIAYIWITEGIYDQEYVATHTFGFEKFKEYVLGVEDAVPKTPKWAEEITGVPARIIKALARLWAGKPTSIMHLAGGPMVRGPYSTEVARLEALLLAMQGLGKPGRQQFSIIGYGIPMPTPPKELLQKLVELRASRDWTLYLGKLAQTDHEELKKELKQFIPKTLVPEAILNPPVSWYSHVFIWCPTECQFEKYKYPADGFPEIHMIWTDTPCWTTCWNSGYKMIDALRSPKIEFVLAQHPWLENDCLFADIILPVTTPFEEEDALVIIGPCNTQHYGLVYSDKCIEPLGESKSDYEICCLIAEKLGPQIGMPDLLDKFTQGKSLKEWLKTFFENSGASNYISFEEWREKGYWLAPVDPEWKKEVPLQTMFAKYPGWFRLSTPSGKIEFDSINLAEHFPDDKERPSTPRWIPYCETWQESLLHLKAKKYPFLLVSNHGRWRMHAQLDDIEWFNEIQTCKVKGQDGILYEPVWINPADAEKLGVKTGDIVKIYNDRGAVLGGAYVTERIMPNVISIDHGARVNLIDDNLDMGGAINLIAPKATGKNTALMVVSGYLVAVEKANLEKLRKSIKKPSRKITPA